MKFKYTHSPAYIAFSSLTIIAAVALLVSISASLLGVTESQASLTYKKGQETLFFAHGCAYESLLRLRDDSSYTGSSVTVDNLSCSIAISNTSGSNYQITIVSTLTDTPNYVQRLLLDVVRSGGSIKVRSWLQQ